MREMRPGEEGVREGVREGVGRGGEAASYCTWGGGELGWERGVMQVWCFGIK